MNSNAILLAITLLFTPWSLAQETRQDSPKDPVQSAIRKFNRNKSKKPAEVSVVLPPPPQEAPAPVTNTIKPEPSTASAPKGPVLVTGKAPEGAEFIKATEETSAPSTAIEEPTPKPQKGLEVRVEKIQGGTGEFDPSQVKILAPFPAKPLAEPPTGWHLESSENAPPFTREVELSPGKHITLTIHPHLLVPNTDPAGVFTIAEPGFDPSLGYRQNTTVAAVLSKSIQQMNEDSKQLGNVIDHLQQFLVSLPKPEPKPDSSPEPAATPAHRPKR
jgi:hypothetical protein